MNMIGSEQSWRVLKSARIHDPAPPAPLELILASLDGSVLVIDDDLRILHANANALADLGCGKGETNFGRYILGEAPSQSLDMRRKIRTAISDVGRTTVALNHARHGRLICSVKGAILPGTTARHGVVRLTREDRPPADVAPYLYDVYRLSKAEAEVAILAAGGAEVSQIILDRNVSIHTLRAQIASIKCKMGLNRMTAIAIAVARIQAGAMV